MNEDYRELEEFEEKYLKECFLKKRELVKNYWEMLINLPSERQLDVLTQLLDESLEYDKLTGNRWNFKKKLEFQTEYKKEFYKDMPNEIWYPFHNFNGNTKKFEKSKSSIRKGVSINEVYKDLIV